MASSGPPMKRRTSSSPSMATIASRSSSVRGRSRRRAVSSVFMAGGARLQSRVYCGIDKDRATHALVAKRSVARPQRSRPLAADQFGQIADQSHGMAHEEAAQRRGAVDGGEAHVADQAQRLDVVGE